MAVESINVFYCHGGVGYFAYLYFVIPRMVLPKTQ